MWYLGTLMAASPSYSPRITEMLVPVSWGENCAYINHSGKEIESNQVVLLEKKTKNIFGYNSRLWSVTVHTKLGRCGKPEPQTLELCLNQFNLIAAIGMGSSMVSWPFCHLHIAHCVHTHKS